MRQVWWWTCYSWVKELVRDFSDSFEIVELEVLRKVKKASSRMETLDGLE